ncbi:MAG: TetR/AcrR family transcriptional regulator [Actinomycetota bacterium]|nr:TetR/AcrR family transcriptional regulator [Actinomycetota bacterium]
MDRSPRQVKGVRAYDASRRQERARQQHAAALDAARVRFLEHGYAATTVESIAEAAGVSAATIYKSYGGKAGLVRELCQRALAGAEPVPAEERSNALRSETDPRQVIEGWGRLTAEVSPRVLPLLLVLRDAAQSDPEAAALFDDLDRQRIARMADNARFLAAAGHLRTGLTARDARDVLWLCTSPELYDLLVNRRRWTIAKYSRFLTDTMTNALI